MPLNIFEETMLHFFKGFFDRKFTNFNKTGGVYIFNWAWGLHETNSNRQNPENNYLFLTVKIHLNMSTPEKVIA